MSITDAQEVSAPQEIGLSISLSIAGTVATSHLTKFDMAKNKNAKSIGAVTSSRVNMIELTAPDSGLAAAWIWKTSFLSQFQTNTILHIANSASFGYVKLNQ